MNNWAGQCLWSYDVAGLIPASPERKNMKGFIICMLAEDAGTMIEKGSVGKCCSKCNSPIIVAPSSVSMSESTGAKFVCLNCVSKVIDDLKA